MQFQKCDIHHCWLLEQVDLAKSQFISQNVSPQFILARHLHNLYFYLMLYLPFSFVRISKQKKTSEREWKIPSCYLFCICHFYLLLLVASLLFAWTSSAKRKAAPEKMTPLLKCLYILIKAVHLGMFLGSEYILTCHTKFYWS